MAIHLEDPQGELNRIVAELDALRSFTGDPSEFWSAFLQGSTRLAGAKFGLLMVRDEENESWRHVGVWPMTAPSEYQGPEIRETVEMVCGLAAERGYAWESLGKRKSSAVVLAIRLRLQEEERASVMVFFLAPHIGKRVSDIAVRMSLISDIPNVYQLGRMAHQARTDVVQFAEALDLTALLNAEKRFVAAAMIFCNELASRFECDRVSLGWLKSSYVRLQAISHMERFDKKMDAVEGIEAAMEEALDQDEEILWPRPEGSSSVVRAHQNHAKEQGSDHIVSVPIRLDDEPVAVVMCERQKAPFGEEEVRGLRLLCDQTARRLSDLKRQDRWIGARMVTSVREGLGKLLGVEHTFAKVMGILLCAALAFLLFGKLPYRVEAPFLLKTDDLAYLPAPFDGYIDKVHVKIGDRVEAGKPVLSLDTRELLLEESTAIANLNRYAREAEKARAENALADMRIAQALADQARARLELVHHHLAHAELKAPFSGIVVEGDLEELLGAPVQKGDVLFKVAKIENMYTELKVDERDIHEVGGGQTGQIAFLSRPDEKFPVTVQRIDPVAVVEEEGNVFLLRAELTEDPAFWWRPGMSGVAKIDVGKRNVLWIVTHRTVDFLRIFLWW
jgi:multidrug resistance efflux pump